MADQYFSGREQGTDDTWKENRNCKVVGSHMYFVHIRNFVGSIYQSCFNKFVKITNINYLYKIFFYQIVIIEF